MTSQIALNEISVNKKTIIIQQGTRAATCYFLLCSLELGFVHSIHKAASFHKLHDVDREATRQFCASVSKFICRQSNFYITENMMIVNNRSSRRLPSAHLPHHRPCKPTKDESRAGRS